MVIEMDDIEKFDKFLSFYDKYYQTVSEISMPCPIHDKDCPSIKHKECVSKSKEPLVIGIRSIFRSRAIPLTIFVGILKL